MNYLISNCSTHRKNVSRLGGGLLEGCIVLFVGGTPVKGGSLCELPKTAF